MRFCSFIVVCLLLFCSTMSLFGQSYEVLRLGGEGSPIVLRDQLASVFYQTRDGFVWVGTGRDVERLDGQSPTVYAFEEAVESSKPAPQRVTALCERRDGELFVGNIQGLWRADHEAHLLRRVAADEIQGQVDALGITADGQLLVTSSKNQYLLNEHDELREVGESVVTIGEQRPVIVEMADGIYLRNAQSGESLGHFTAENSPLLSNQISSAYVLRDGSVLCGTPFYQGFNLLRPKSEGVECMNGVLLEDRSIYVRAYLQTPLHRFVGTREGFYMGGRLFSSASHAALRSDIIFCFAPWQGDSILVGTCGGGLAVFDPISQRFGSNVLTERCVPHGDIFQIRQEGDRTWLATSEGLFCYSPREGLRQFGQADALLPGNLIYGFSLCPFLLATDGGVVTFDTKAGRCVEALSSEPTRNVFGTRNGQHMFYLLLDNRVIVDGELLPGILAYDMMEAPDGTLYFATPQGVLRMSADLKSYRLLTDGQQHLECSPGARLSWGDDGCLVVCATDGLYAVSTSRPLPLRRAVIMSQERESASVVAFTCTTPDLAFLPDSRFEYMLDGDTQWQRVEADNRLQFVDLPSGSHQLRVRLLLDSDSEANLSFRIPCDYTLLYMALLVALVIGTLFVVYLLRLRKKDVMAEKPVVPKSVVPKDEAERVAEQLRHYMQENKAYLNVDLKQAEVAVAIGQPTYVVSGVLSQHLGMNWYDFVNSYRIEAFKQAVVQGESERYSIVSLAEQCGFKSKASFFRAFKAQTGMTPSEYIGRTK